MKIRTLATVAFLACVVSACTSDMGALVQTARSVITSDSAIDSAQLNPQFRYLRVTISGRAVLLVLGYVDQHPQGQIEVWYSAEREVVRLQNGRVVGAIGLITEWRNVLLAQVPSWSAVAKTQAPVNLTRMRDVMPGYRFGVKDALVLSVIPAVRQSALQGIDPQGLTWFEERVQPEVRAGYTEALRTAFSVEKLLPPARYAVDLQEAREVVVYGEQCLAPDLCFTWQRWKP